MKVLPVSIEEFAASQEDAKWVSWTDLGCATLVVLQKPDGSQEVMVSTSSGHYAKIVS